MRLSDGEWKVMQVVWDSGPVTARDVLDAVAPETRWAYTTVKTVLDRLVAKGALSLDKAAAAGVYRAALSREKARRHAVKGLVERAFDGAFAPLLRFAVEGRSLTDKDRAALRKLLDEEESRSRKRGRRAPGK